MTDLRKAVDGILKMVRRPSGVFAGNAIQTIAAQVDQLHHERFESGGGILGDHSAAPVDGTEQTPEL